MAFDEADFGDLNGEDWNLLVDAIDPPPMEATQATEQPTDTQPIMQTTDPVTEINRHLGEWLASSDKEKVPRQELAANLAAYVFKVLKASPDPNDDDGEAWFTTQVKDILKTTMLEGKAPSPCSDTKFDVFLQTTLQGLQDRTSAAFELLLRNFQIPSLDVDDLKQHLGIQGDCKTIAACVDHANKDFQLLLPWESEITAPDISGLPVRFPANKLDGIRDCEEFGAGLFVSTHFEQAKSFFPGDARFWYMRHCLLCVTRRAIRHIHVSLTTMLGTWVTEFEATVDCQTRVQHLHDFIGMALTVHGSVSDSLYMAHDLPPTGLKNLLDRFVCFGKGSTHCQWSDCTLDFGVSTHLRHAYLRGQPVGWKKSWCQEWYCGWCVYHILNDAQDFCCRQFGSSAGSAAGGPPKQSKFQNFTVTKSNSTTCTGPGTRQPGNGSFPLINLDTPLSYSDLRSLEEHFRQCHVSVNGTDVVPEGLKGSLNAQRSAFSASFLVLALLSKIKSDDMLSQRELQESIVLINCDISLPVELRKNSHIESALQRLKQVDVLEGGDGTDIQRVYNWVVCNPSFNPKEDAPTVTWNASVDPFALNWAFGASACASWLLGNSVDGPSKTSAPLPDTNMVASESILKGLMTSSPEGGLVVKAFHADLHRIYNSLIRTVDSAREEVDKIAKKFGSLSCINLQITETQVQIDAGGATDGQSRPAKALKIVQTEFKKITQRFDCHPCLTTEGRALEIPRLVDFMLHPYGSFRDAVLLHDEPGLVKGYINHHILQIRDLLRRLGLSPWQRPIPAGDPTDIGVPELESSLHTLDLDIQNVEIHLMQLDHICHALSEGHYALPPQAQHPASLQRLQELESLREAHKQSLKSAAGCSVEAPEVVELASLGFTVQTLLCGGPGNASWSVACTIFRPSLTSCFSLT